MKKTLKLIPFAINKIAYLCFLMWVSGIAGYSSIAADSPDDRRPNEHFCPITLDVMRNPVVAADGHSYERHAISKHMSISAKSPLTGLPLKNRDLVANHALKVMIGEWKPGRQREPSALETRSADDIAQRVREEFTKNAALFNAAKAQHIVAFLGNTGAGKSTLVNFLAGKELKVGPYEEDYVLAHPEDKTAMAIGTGGNSETLYPKFIDVGSLRFFDLPGFNDTDGTERNLVNAAFTRRILLDAASVRLVFVAGQDQFTVDRSASVKQMFNCIKQLLVVGQNISLIDDSVFVATKMTWNRQGDLVDYLSRRTNTNDRTELSDQLKSWNQRDKLCCMFHPIRDGNNKGIKDQILRFIKDTKPAKILGINVSVLYPPDTKSPLERMFLRVMEDAFNRNLKACLETLVDQECYSYDKAIASYGSDTFWSTFDVDVCKDEDAIGLLKEFCINPYNKAFKRFKEENEGKRQKHIGVLQDKRKERIEDIKRSFFDLLNGAFGRNLNVPLTTLSDYDAAIASYGSDAFWATFGTTISTQQDMVALLKKFCKSHYQDALKRFEEGNEGKRQAHARVLKDRRQERIGDIERRTDLRIKEVISSLVPKQESDDFVFFDFAWHKDIHNQVCGSGSIKKLAIDAQEQAVVRRYYAGFISQHSHEQMMRWHQKFSGIEALALAQQKEALAQQNIDLKKQLEETQKRLYVLEEPLRIAREAEAEQQNIQAQKLARQKAAEAQKQIVEAEKAAEAERIRLSVPLAAQGHETIYQRFLKGVLIYRPKKGTDIGMITLPISALGNPLEGTFDLSQCGDMGTYLSISTGYRKGKKAENANKIEIWFTPRFLIEKELNTTAKHFQGIFPTWNDSAPVGIFWTWGGWDNLGDFDYLTTENMDNLSKINLGAVPDNYFKTVLTHCLS